MRKLALAALAAFVLAGIGTANAEVCFTDRTQIYTNNGTTCIVGYTKRNGETFVVNECGKLVKMLVIVQENKTCGVFTLSDEQGKEFELPSRLSPTNQ